MGEVYRARDAQLGREVAVKVLPAGVAGDGPEFERFQREARIIARLSHPNILEIYDFGHQDGVTYAVTELLDGRDLQERMSSRRMDAAKALEVAAAVAEGLGAAHSEGVIHRDIKPANIFITATGRVKILDFGLARGAPPEDIDPEGNTEAGPLTAPGAVFGTAGYMSPEQVRGHSVDARSDIFAVGCVLYEMLSGQHPFRRHTVIDTMSAILTDTPPPITTLEPDLPKALDHLLDRCLKKDRGERFESARDVAFALSAIGDTRVPSEMARHVRTARAGRKFRVAASVLGALLAVAFAFGGWWWWSARPEMPDEKRLAVVGFATPSKDPAEQQFAAGLTEVIADGLTLLEEQSRGELWVVPRRLMTSTELDSVSRMHRDYNINLSIAGELQASGDMVRFALTVVDAASGRRLSSSEIEDDISNLSSFQQEPILRLAGMLGIEPSPQTQTRLDESSTSVATAFMPYVRGRGLLRVRNEAEDLDTAIDLLREAAVEDPLFSRAHEALSMAYLEKFSATRDPEWSELGLEAARQVIARKPTALAYRALAAHLQARGEHGQAISALEEATRVAVASGETHLSLGHAYHSVGRFDDARRAYERSINCRPGFWRGHYWLGALYLATGDYDGTANQFRQVIQCAPSYPNGYNNLGGVLHTVGRIHQAREMYERSIEVEPLDNYSAFSNLGTLYFEAAQYANAAAMFERALEQDDTQYLMWGNLGWAYAFGVASDRAEAQFRRALELGEGELARQPDDADLLSELAGYYAMIGDQDRALEHQESAIEKDPTDPLVLASIGENFEKLGDRDRALHWIEKAIRAGYPPHRFEERPAMGGLIADERYQELVEHPRGNPISPAGDRPAGS